MNSKQQVTSKSQFKEPIFNLKWGTILVAIGFFLIEKVKSFCFMCIYINLLAPIYNIFCILKLGCMIAHFIITHR